MSSKRVIKQVTFLISALIRAGKIESNFTKRVIKPIQVKWEKLENDWMKLNTDGSLKSDNKAAGGGVVRNNKDDVIWGFYDFYNEGSIIEAELRAIESELSLCWKDEIRKIWVETDSKAAIELIHHQSGPWVIQYTLQSIRCYLGKMEVKITHVWIEGNKVAAWLVYKGFNEKKYRKFKGEELQGYVKRPY